MTQPTVTPLSRTIELQLAGQPAVKNRWGSGHINPTHTVITYLDNQYTAHLYGTWIREDGELTDAPVDQLYRHDDTWPDWLANLAREHGPAAQKPQRGDGFEAWLKTQRDEHRDDNRGRWSAYDDLLDLYRLHADMGAPLDGHVCEVVVGDCERLEPGVS